MRLLALLCALLLGMSSLLPPAADAATRRHFGKTMTVRLANGKAVTMRIVRYHGTLMAMVPAADLSDVFHRPH